MQTAGLQLCDWAASSSYGAAQCDARYDGGCQGGANDNCYPHIIWSGKQVSSTYSWSPELAQGRFFEYKGEAGHITTQAMSVRCVLDLNKYRQLQLCDQCESSEYGAVRCGWLTFGCQGAIGYHCWPYWVWGTLVSDRSKAYDRALDSGSFAFDSNSPHDITFAFSVRCVPDLNYRPNTDRRFAALRQWGKFLLRRCAVQF